MVVVLLRWLGVVSSSLLVGLGCLGRGDMVFLSSWLWGRLRALCPRMGGWVACEWMGGGVFLLVCVGFGSGFWKCVVVALLGEVVLSWLLVGFRALAWSVGVMCGVLSSFQVRFHD